MSLKDLAKEVYLSTPAVSARIEKMEKEGIIKGYGVRIDPLKLGFHITAFINMDIECIISPAAGFYLVSFLIDQADITVLQCSMPAAGEA